ncbi:MAG: amidohydrolase family protein [Gemmatimonadota bacterium]
MRGTRSLASRVAAVAASAVLAAPASAQVQVLVGATVVDGTGAAPLPDGVVLVDGARITCVGTRGECPVPEGATMVDLKGRYITPGLVDAHVHFSQTGWLDGRPDGVSAPDVYPYAETARDAKSHPERWYRSYLCSGITSVFDVGGHPWTTELPAAAEDDPGAVHVRAAGPLVTHARVPALNLDDEFFTFLPMGSVEEARRSVERLAAMGSSAVKVWYVRPPPERARELDAIVMAVGEAARRAGLDLIVHATGLREAKVALRAGASLLVHSVEDRLVDREFLDLLLKNGAVYTPTLTVGEGWSRAMASIVLDDPQEVDDPHGCVDPGTLAKIQAPGLLRSYLPERILEHPVAYVRRRFERVGRSQVVMAENLRRVHRAGARVATGTDAGNPLTLHGPSIYGEMEAMQAAGLTPMEVLVMSTRNGAAAMDRLAEVGTLEPGKVADLLVLQEDPTRDVKAFRSVGQVMRAGVFHAVEDLARSAASREEGEEESMTPPPVHLVQQPLTARPGDDEYSIAPDLLLDPAREVIASAGLEVSGVEKAELTAGERDLYGVWRRVALADGHLGRLVTPAARQGDFIVGLLGNCISSWGMLAGLQNSEGAGHPRRVGMVWIDAHGDFNTPETTLSGWLGGMPVSVAAGQSLEMLRNLAGLTVPLPTRNVVMMGLRDVDPLEEVLIRDSEIAVLSAAEMVAAGPAMMRVVEELAKRVDIIYVHVDLDILDATEIPGSFFETPGGPTAREVAGVLRRLMSVPKVGALGLASFPTAEEGRERSMASTMTVLRGAMAGLAGR